MCRRGEKITTLCTQDYHKTFSSNSYRNHNALASKYALEHSTKVHSWNQTICGGKLSFGQPIKFPTNADTSGFSHLAKWISKQITIQEH